MDTPLKQRLVGALILLALGVIFWPIIFVQPEDRPLPDTGAVPAAPRIEEASIEAPGFDLESTEREPAIAAPAEADVRFPDSADVPAESAPLVTGSDGPTVREERPEVPVLDEEGIPLAWALQVATMSSLDKARALREELNEQGLKAYLKPLRRGQDTLHRVYVGPKFERADIEAIKERIDARYGVESLVARYVP